jgi:hypothetical protein
VDTNDTVVKQGLSQTQELIDNLLVPCPGLCHKQLSYANSLAIEGDDLGEARAVPPFICKNALKSVMKFQNLEPN